MKQFQYLTPKTLDEAISLHVSHGESAKYIAGGTDVMVKIKEGKLAPEYLISLKHIIGQDQPFLNQESGELYIGAFCTHGSIEASPLIQHQYPIIHDAVKNIGSVQIRNVATIGGNLVNAVPSADGAIPLIALDAKAHIYGTKGQRSVELRRFFLGPGQCDLEAGEILTEIVIPPLLPRTGSAYVKHGRREAMELPMLGVGVLLSLEKDML
ncbi:MAG: FAD binding domain-containing protein, partial [Desulfobacterales bacterium]